MLCVTVINTRCDETVGKVADDAFSLIRAEHASEARTDAGREHETTPQSAGCKREDQAQREDQEERGEPLSCSGEGTAADEDGGLACEGAPAPADQVAEESSRSPEGVLSAASPSRECLGLTRVSGGGMGMVPKLELPSGLGRESAIPDATSTGSMTNREKWEREKEHLNAIHALSLAESLKALSTPRERDEVMRTRSRGGRYPSRRSRGSSQKLEVDKAVKVAVEMEVEVESGRRDRRRSGEGVEDRADADHRSVAHPRHVYQEPSIVLTGDTSK